MKQTRTIVVNNDNEAWKANAELLADGFTKTSDCYWYQNYHKGDVMIIIERA